jgi:hypothetical protein
LRSWESVSTSSANTKTGEEFFLAGREMTAWIAGLSFLAALGMLWRRARGRLPGVAGGHAFFDRHVGLGEARSLVQRRQTAVRALKALQEVQHQQNATLRAHEENR